MKRKLLMFLVFLVPIFCLAQDIILPNISTPSGFSIGTMNGVMLGENLIGPRKILFSGSQFQREEMGIKISGFGVRAPNIDKLQTFFSGRIFSPGIIEPFVFENRTPEELNMLEITVFPKILEQPYSLFMDLIIRTSSKPISAEQSDDTGKYETKILITLIEI